MRVTEAAALAAGRWAGRGDKEGGDGAAVDAMRDVIASVPMRGVVVIGEGEKDEAPMLYNGEEVGDGTGPEYRHRRRPGGRHHAAGQRDAERDRGAWPPPTGAACTTRARCSTWTSWSARGAVAGEVDIDAPVEHNMRAVARALGGRPADVTVSVLNRPRHEQLIADGPRDRGADQADLPTATWPRAIAAATARTPASTCCSASAARRRGSSPRAR